MIKLLLTSLLLIILSACNGGGGGSSSSGGGSPTPPVGESNEINLNYNINEESSTPVNLISQNINFYNYVLISGPTKGVLSGTAPYLTYTSSPNASGVDTFSYSLISTNPDQLSSKTVNVKITIAGENDRPVANPLELYVQKGNGFIFNLSGSDADGDTLSYRISIPPSRGNIFSMSGSQFGYDADNQIYDVTFSYVVNDGKIDSLPATVIIHVTRANSAPVLVSSPNITLLEDAIDHAVTLSVTDADSDPLTSTVTVAPTHGTLSGTFPNYKYSPVLNYNGPDSFKLKIKDAYGGVIEPLFNLTIQSVNDLPIANSVTVNMASNAPFKQIILTGTDPDLGQTLSYAILTYPTKGIVGINSNGIATYDIYTNQQGSDSFTYRISDGIGMSTVATVTILIDQVLNPPVAYNDNIAVAEGNQVNITLTGFSLDSNLIYTITDQPTKGTLTGLGSNLVYKANEGATGQDLISFKITDSQNQESNTAGIVIQINEAPIMYTGFSLSGTSQESKFLKNLAQGINNKLFLNLENDISTSYSWQMTKPNVCQSTNNDTWNVFQVGVVDSLTDVQRKNFNFQDLVWTCDANNKMTSGSQQIYTDGEILVLSEIPNISAQIWVGFKNSSINYGADLNILQSISVNKVFSTNYAFVQESAQTSWFIDTNINGQVGYKNFIRLLGYSKRLDPQDEESQVDLYSNIIDQGSYYDLNGLYYENNGEMIQILSHTNICEPDAVDCEDETINLNQTIGHGFNSEKEAIFSMKYFLGEVLTDNSPGGDLTPEPTKENEIRVEASKQIIIYKGL